MSCDGPPIFIEDLQTCNLTDASTKAAAGVVVTEAGSGDLLVTPAVGDPPPTDGHVLVYDSGSSPPLSWQAQSGGGGGGPPDYQTLASPGAINSPIPDVVEITAGASSSVTLPDGTVSGHVVTITLASVTLGHAVTIQPTAPFQDGRANVKLTSVGQSEQLVWLNSGAWAQVAKPPEYENITNFATPIHGTREVVTLDASGQGSVGTNLEDGVTPGHLLDIILVGIDGGETCTITPDTALLGGGATIEMSVVGQGIMLVWAGSAWVQRNGGATIG